MIWTSQARILVRVEPPIKEPPNMWQLTNKMFVNTFILKSMETSGNKTTSVFWM